MNKALEEMMAVKADFPIQIEEGMDAEGGLLCSLTGSCSVTCDRTCTGTCANTGA
jgi:hypothetical protein